ncbi:MAG: PEP-CTERM sorting domain-containing protein [Nitrospirae bacterium]|nr:PEP-CTERM sorting domain-containing protein [Nitrospirota bacterium]
MKRIINIFGLVIFIIIFHSSISLGTPIGGPHLWLSTDSATPGSGGNGYVGTVGDPWFDDSYLTSNNPFDLFIYNASSGNKAVSATGIHLMITIHDGESGIVTVNGIDYSLFNNILLPSQYGGGNHGIYDDPVTTNHDGRYAVVDLGFDLAPLSSRSAIISWAGFSEVHFDVFSLNGFWNPPSHDATAFNNPPPPPPPIPEPSTMLLLGSGLVGLLSFRKKLKK